MPKAQERKLKKIAAEKGMKGERADAFVYGSMRREGWKPKRERSTANKKAAPRKAGR